MARPISPSILHQIFDAPDLPEPHSCEWQDKLVEAVAIIAVLIIWGSVSYAIWRL